jgi:hypothetical protein
LTIEQLEASRRKALADADKAAADAAERAKNNTNVAKFLNNLESRIYATLSKQLADQMFSESGAQSGIFNLDSNGSTIAWSKTWMDATTGKEIPTSQCATTATSCSNGLQAVKMVISSPSYSSGTTEVIAPIGTFAF